MRSFLILLLLVVVLFPTRVFAQAPNTDTAPLRGKAKAALKSYEAKAKAALKGYDAKVKAALKSYEKAVAEAHDQRMESLIAQDDILIKKLRIAMKECVDNEKYDEVARIVAAMKRAKNRLQQHKKPLKAKRRQNFTIAASKKDKPETKAERSQTFTVAANKKEWQGKAKVIEGKTYTVLATGKWSIYGDSPMSDAHGQMHEGTKLGFLEGKIFGSVAGDRDPKSQGDGPAFRIGSGKVFVAQRTGVLCFRMKDKEEYYSDNRGSLKVTVTPGGRSVYLADLAVKEEDQSIGHGNLGRNGDLGWTHGSGIDYVIVNGDKKKHALAFHPPRKGSCFVRYHVTGWSKLKGGIAINDSSEGRSHYAPLVFEVLGDGKVLKTMRMADKGHVTPFNVGIRGFTTLELRVTCSDDYSGAHAVWIDPTLMK